MKLGTPGVGGVGGVCGGGPAGGTVVVVVCGAVDVVSGSVVVVVDSGTVVVVVDSWDGGRRVRHRGGGVRDGGGRRGRRGRGGDDDLVETEAGRLHRLGLADGDHVRVPDPRVDGPQLHRLTIEGDLADGPGPGRTPYEVLEVAAHPRRGDHVTGGVEELQHVLLVRLLEGGFAVPVPVECAGPQVVGAGGNRDADRLTGRVRAVADHDHRAGARFVADAREIDDLAVAGAVTCVLRGGHRRWEERRGRRDSGDGGDLEGTGADHSKPTWSSGWDRVGFALALHRTKRPVTVRRVIASRSGECRRPTAGEA